MSKKTAVTHCPKYTRKVWAGQLVVLKTTIHRLLWELGQGVPISQTQMPDSLIFTNLLIRIARHGRLKAPVEDERCGLQFLQQKPLDKNLTSFGSLRIKARAERTRPSPCSLRSITDTEMDLCHGTPSLLSYADGLGLMPLSLYLRSVRDEGTNLETPPKDVSQNGAPGTQAPSEIQESRPRKGHVNVYHLAVSLHSCDLSI